MNKLRIKRLYNYIDGLEYMSRYTSNIKKVGTSYKACCPFHNERTPSFTIYPKGFMTRDGVQEYDSFYCFGCNAGGDIIRFCELINGISREEAIKKLEIEFDIVVDDNVDTSFLLNEIKKIKNKSIKLLTFSEINLLLSIICRKYLEFIKQKYIDYYEYEKNLIDHYYRYIDYILPNCNNYEANLLYLKINKKLYERKKLFIHLD